MAIRLKVIGNDAVRLKVGGNEETVLHVGAGVPIYPSPYSDVYEVTPTESEQTLSTNGLMMTDDVTVHAIDSEYVGSEVPRKSSADLTSSGATVSVPSGYYEEGASKDIPTGTVVPPVAISSVTSTLTAEDDVITLYKKVNVAPYVSTPGYISEGTRGDIDVTLKHSVPTRSSADLTANGNTVTAPSGYYGSNASASVQSGSATTPTGGITANPTISVSSSGLITASVSKSESITPIINEGYVTSGTAGNSSVSLTANVTTKAAATIYPSASDQTISSSTYLTGTQTIKGVTYSNLTADNIKNGVTVTIGDSADADRILSVTGTYSGGGGTVQYDTKTVTASNYPTSLEFSSMKGEPKAFVVRLNAQVSSSGSTTYYYIVDISHFGTTTHGNCFRIGSTRRVDNITSGYSYSYSGTTLTITSSAASRSASPGAFYSGSYELIYAY